MKSCPLCKSKAEGFFRDKRRTYFLCQLCNAVFVDNQYFPDRESEISRYHEHNNDVNDPGYQQFVNPILNEILQNFTPSHRGLDFGAGTGPVISKLLSDNKYQIVQYDPFFHYFPELLERRYDYIVCCEVIEHFHHPEKEFQLLKNLLTENGKLYCMTSIYSEPIDFKNWYYKNDLTHVIFYQTKTLNYVRQKFGFSDIRIDENLVIFTK